MRKFYFSLFMLIIGTIVRSQTFELVKDINPGTNNSSAGNLAAINGKIFFKADDGIHGSEFWITDGIEANTFLFKDINPGTGSSNPSGFVRIGNTIYFIADDGVHGSELWKTNGTEAGTVMVKDINPGTGGSTSASFINMGGKLFFVATDGAHGRELWKTDGTEAGTVMVKDINTNNTGSNFPGNNGYPASLTIMNGVLYFTATEGIDKQALWKTDGTEAGTVLIKYVTINQIKNINNTLFFSGTGDPVNSLWKSDGTVDGTVMLKTTGALSLLTDVNGVAMFYSLAGGLTNVKIWKSDGTVDGTEAIKTINVTGGVIGYFINVNGTLFFVAPHPTGGTEIWKSDGTEAGTTIVKDIYAGATTSQPSSLASIDGKLFFSATNGVFGNEIWRSDGTEEGTVMMQDIAIPGNAMPQEFTLLGTKLFVTATDNIHGRELWVADLAGPPGGLPLTMLEFKGQLVNKDALLTWKTVAEHNTSHFEIERSIDGRVFAQTAALNAAGTTTVTKSYTFTDRNVTLLGVPAVYYRLKMKDLDGKFTYSKIIAVNINHPAGIVLFYPNPAIENATLMISSLKKENISYNIIDQHGRTMLSKTILINEGSNMIPVETAALAAGIYTIVLKGPVTHTSVKFMKQ
jgi:ELWxxDGT repeat protein